MGTVRQRGGVWWVRYCRDGKRHEESSHSATKQTAIDLLKKQKQLGQNICMFTAYDATFARILDESGADVLLVGDSLGMVVQGHDSTLPVTMDQMVYHSRAVSRGAKRAHVVGDLPFLSYQTN